MYLRLGDHHVGRYVWYSGTVHPLVAIEINEGGTTTWVAKCTVVLRLFLYVPLSGDNSRDRYIKGSMYFWLGCRQVKTKKNVPAGREFYRL